MKKKKKSLQLEHPTITSPTQVPHYNVVFATPGASMLPGYVRSLIKTIYFLDQQGITWNYMTEYSSLVAHAREKTIGGTGHQDPTNSKPGHGAWTYDKIMWIDSDIAWEPEDFFRLFESDKEVISGCYMLEDTTVALYLEPLGASMPNQAVLALEEPFKVRGCGFGFLCVKQGVFENMDRPWFSQIDVEVVDKETGEVSYKFPLMGEDLSWCEKVHRMGKEVWADPKVRVTHHKQVPLLWEYFTRF